MRRLAPNLGESGLALGKPKSLGRGFTITLLARAAELLQGLIVIPIVIRLSGPAVYGSYILVMSALSFCMLVVDVGISYRYQRRLISAASPAERRSLFEPQFTFQVLAVAVISVVVVLAAPWLEKSLFAGEVNVAPWPIIAQLTSHLLYMQAVCYCLYGGRQTVFNIAWAAAPYVFMTVLVLGAAVGLTLSLNTLLALQAAAGFCTAIPPLVILLRDIGLPRLRLPLRVLMTDAGAAFPLLLQRVAAEGLRLADRYLILAFLSVVAVGQYQPAFAVGSVIMVVPSIIGTLLTPSLSRLFDLGERRAAERLHAAALRTFMMCALPFVIGALLIGPSLLALLTSPDIAFAGRWVVPLAAVASLFFGATRLFEQVAFVLTRTRAILLATFVAMGADITLNSILLPLVKDISSAGVAILIGYVASCFCLFGQIRDEWSLTIDWRAVSRFAAAAVLMGTVLWLLGYRPGSITGSGPVGLAGAVCLGALVYFVVLSALGVFGRREIRDLTDVMQGRAGEAQ